MTTFLWLMLGVLAVVMLVLIIKAPNGKNSGKCK